MTKYSLLLILLVSASLKAQFSSGDAVLINSVFRREFNKNIIRSYLNSGQIRKQRAALIAIANSADSSFIPELIPLRKKELISDICYALGCLPASRTSAVFLWKIIDTGYDPTILQYAYEGLGKTGLRSDYDTLISKYFSGRLSNKSGISKAIYRFAIRNIRTESATELIKSEFLRNRNNPEELKEIVFVIYRAMPEPVYKETLAEFLNNAQFTSFSPGLLQYLLGACRKLGILPIAVSRLDELTHNINSTVRIETAKALPGFKSSETARNQFFCSLIQDKNPNVSLQAAISIRTISSISSENKYELLDKVSGLIKSGKLLPNTECELIISALKLEPKLIQFLRNRIIQSEPQFRAKVYAAFPELFQNELKEFSLIIPSLPRLKQFLCVKPLTELTGSKNKPQALDSLLIGCLNSGNPALISLVSENLSPEFYHLYKKEIGEAFKNLCVKHKDNPDFSDAFASVIPVCSKIDSGLNSELGKLLADTKLNSLAKLIGKSAPKKDIPLDILLAVGKYNTAVVSTTKGKFTLNIDYSYSPVTAANFTVLAGKGFFNNILFHRVVPGFVIQTGDTTNTGTGGPGYEIISEFSDRHYSPGVLGMARSGFDSEGSQWFVTTGEFFHLDGLYSVFGTVRSGYEVVENIDETDYILSVTVQ